MVRNVALVTNHQLNRLLRTAGLSNAGFAKAVARELRLQHGTRHAYNQASTARWLRGARPYPEAQAAMAAVLSRDLGRHIAIEELGFVVEWGVGDLLAAAAIPETEHDPMDPLSRRRTLTLLAAPLLAELPAAPALARTASAAHVGSAGDGDAAAIWSAARELLRLDTRFGGAAVHRGAADMFESIAAPLLSADRVSPAVYGASGYLAQVAGYSAQDAGDLPGAGLWLRRAARLARDGGDQLVRAGAMTDLSLTATSAGHPEEGAQIAEAAAALDALPGAYRARALAAAARAYGRTGQRDQVRRAHESALAALDAPGERGSASDTLSDIYSTGHLASEFSYPYAETDPAAALTAVEQAGVTPAGMPRRAMAIAATSARALLAQGELEAALPHARAALRGQAALPRSARAAEHAHRLRAALAPFASRPAVAELVAAA